MKIICKIPVFRLRHVVFLFYQWLFRVHIQREMNALFSVDVCVYILKFMSSVLFYSLHVFFSSFLVHWVVYSGNFKFTVVILRKLEFFFFLGGGHVIFISKWACSDTSDNILSCFQALPALISNLNASWARSHSCFYFMTYKNS